MPTKETPMPAEPVDASGRTRADRAEDLTHADTVRRLGPPTVISLDRLTKLAEQAIADHSVCVNEDCPDERIIPPSVRWFVEDYLPAALADSAAPRASQGATATHSTGDDAGAAHDPHKPAAAFSGGHVLVRTGDLAEVLAVASGLVTPGTTSDVIDRLNAALTEAV